MMLITLYCGGIACNTHRGSEKTVTPTENTLPLCRTSRVAQALKHLHKQAKNAWQPTWCKQCIQQSWRGQCADNSAHKVQICLHAVTHWYSILYKQKCRVQTKSRKAVWDIIPNIFARIYYTTWLLSHTATAPHMATPFWQTLAYNNATSQKDQAPVPQQHINTAKIKSSCR